jgi:hypothetical protein
MYIRVGVHWRFPFLLLFFGSRSDVRWQTSYERYEWRASMHSRWISLVSDIESLAFKVGVFFLVALSFNGSSNPLLFATVGRRYTSTYTQQETNILLYISGKYYFSKHASSDLHDCHQLQDEFL